MKKKILLMAVVWVGVILQSTSHAVASAEEAQGYGAIFRDYLNGENIADVRAEMEGLGYVCGGQGEFLIIQDDVVGKIDDRIAISALERGGVFESEEDVICFESDRAAATLYLSKNLVSNKMVWQDFFFSRVPKGHIIFSKFSQYSGAVERTIHINCYGLEICPYPVRQRDTLGSFSDEDYSTTFSGLELGFGETFSRTLRQDTRFHTFICGNVGLEYETCIHTWRDHLDSRVIKDQWMSITSAKASHLKNDVASIIPIETNNDEFRLAELQEKAAEIERAERQRPNREADEKTAFAEAMCTANLPRLEQIFQMRNDIDMDYALDLVLRADEKIAPFLYSRVLEIYEQPELAETGMTSGAWMTLCIFELSK